MADEALLVSAAAVFFAVVGVLFVPLMLLVSLVSLVSCRRKVR
jgi:hypothetical protein